jgi:YidC/Oxa1 family membrane protein insertase
LPEYRNPQQEPGGGGDKRMLMVFAVTFALIILFQVFLFKKPPAQPPKNESVPTQANQTPAPTSQAPPQPATPAQAPSKHATQPGKAPPAQSTPAKAAAGQSETVVENDVYRITFSNQGAVVKSWVLKKYKDEDGKPLDLVNKAAAEKFGFPLSLYTYDQGLSDLVNKQALYVPSATGTMNAPGELTFEYAQNGVVVRKSFIFGNEYQISIETQVTKDGGVVHAFPMWPAGFGDETTAAGYASERIEYQAVGERNPERIAAKKVSGGNTIRGPFNWAGPQDQFFAAIFLPDNPDSATMVTLRNSLALPKDPKKPDPNDLVHYEVLGAAVGDTSGITKARLFVGPKTLSVLESVRSNSAPGQMNGPDLRNVVDFGFFSIIARPLFIWLRWTHIYIHNWGLCIVILTICINLALLPLRITSTKSALKMQRLQPQMKAIQEKYKKLPMRDPKRQEMNAEIGELYKREGVNPAGGCLPLLIQMPFLFAFYTMLQNAIELRQAPFLWLHDLSAPDKLFIMPVLIVISTYLMQKMTPNAGMDPKQQQMMTLMMPLMIGWFSFNLPSGLSVYWIVGNIILMIQQYVINKSHLGQELRAEMEKRARKKAGK